MRCRQRLQLDTFELETRQRVLDQLQTSLHGTLQRSTCMRASTARTCHSGREAETCSSACSVRRSPSASSQIAYNESWLSNSRTGMSAMPPPRSEHFGAPSRAFCVTPTAQHWSSRKHASANWPGCKAHSPVDLTLRRRARISGSQSATVNRDLQRRPLLCRRLLADMHECLKPHGTCQGKMIHEYIS